MPKPIVVAVLETMWGTPGKALGMFRINPQNHTGRRLYWLLRGRDVQLWCTNACPEQVASAKQHGRPDPKWLRSNLNRIKPSLILICGAVANETFGKCGYIPECKVLQLPHPAWRGWTRKLLDNCRNLVQEALS